MNFFQVFTAWAVALGVCAALPAPLLAADGPADIIIVNGRVFTASRPAVVADSVAIRGRHIVAVGGAAATAPLRGKHTRIIDARGATVTPGFNDAHVHFLSGALGLSWVQLLDAQALAQVQARIREFAAAHPERPWVLGRGWWYGSFPGGLPTRQQLDKLVPDRPAVMECYDGHTRWLNSKALAAAGITKNSRDPPDGQIVRDAAGEPTGVLKEGAQRLVDHVVPVPTREEKLAALKEGMALAHRLGVTSVQEAGVTPGELELFDALNRAGELPLRLYIALSAAAGMTGADLVQLDELRRAHAGDDRLRLGAVKLYADGVIESRTAAMLEPYANGDTRGNPEFTVAELNRVVAALDRDHWQIWIHAIGDGGIRMALDAIELAQRANPARDRRHRLEHVEAVSAADISRFASLGVIASMQPFHASPNQNILEVWAGNIGPERAGRAWAWKSIRDAGGRIAFGTDWPVVGLDPRPGLHTALTRRTPEGQPPGGFVPEQRLPLRAVLGAYTVGAAVAAFDEQRVGTLAPGMLADIVIWSEDLAALPADKVSKASVRMTLFDGRVVYDRDAGP